MKSLIIPLMDGETEIGRAEIVAPTLAPLAADGRTGELVLRHRNLAPRETQRLIDLAAAVWLGHGGGKLICAEPPPSVGAWDAWRFHPDPSAPEIIAGADGPRGEVRMRRGYWVLTTLRPLGETDMVTPAEAGRIARGESDTIVDGDSG